MIVRDYAQLTAQHKIDVLARLIDGQSGAEAGSALGISYPVVCEVQKRHGYPSLVKMDAAIGMLRQRVLDEGHVVSPVKPPPAAVPQRDAWAVLAPIGGMRKAAEESGNRKLLRLAQKATDAVQALSDALQEWHKDTAARETAKAAETARVARITQLELELANLRSGRRPKVTPLPKPAKVRKLTGETYPCQAPQCGRTFDTKQGLWLHGRRVHTPGDAA